MIKTERTAVMNLENAIRGARNPMNSWAKSDSLFDEGGNFVLGPNDLDLAGRLCRAGSDHRKFLRQIFVSVDITAPIYWWKEFDTYKVGTTANSTSTMHKIHSKPFEESDFSFDRVDQSAREWMESTIRELEKLRLRYVETRDKSLWYTLIQLLPCGYQQMRTVTMTYENLRNMYFARKDHKLDEWHEFCAWMEGLPYSAELIRSVGE